ncbi:MAG: S-layer homology domain-containing protein [Thermosynechococcaceae cyanobacterium]
MAIRHTLITTAMGFVLLLSLAGCNGKTIEQAFSADPNVSRWGSSTLPTGFPEALRYPQAQLQTQADLQATTDQPSALRQTRWSTSDPSAQVQTFYQELFQGKDWQLVDQATTRSQTVLTARQKDLQVKVTIETTPQAQRSGGASPLVIQPGTALTLFQIEYGPSSATVASNPSTPVSQGLVSPSPQASANASLTAASSFDDLEKVPAELQPYVNDLAQLGILTPGAVSQDDSGAATTLFDPNQIISRGTFARWLVEANNRIYKDRPTQQIRVATTTTEPAFQDVPASDPLFPYVQGLADAGYIPSKLTGDSKETLFKPQQPLTRETLLAWKVPVDLRKILPTATSAKVQQVWGFKDASRVSPSALAAVLADHQNGDLGNIRRLVGSALLFQPQKTVTRAEAAAALWFIGKEGEGFSAKDVLRADRQAESTSSQE